ncbi:hypothetical protein BT93_L4939 [Corymbia citriodora subsp. variegata]|uniref:Uncharacterized protein n=1 Tax=Corymbia citriodora subsp. variegata TaxID=360336 RepID=A0A8T0CT97_CORYI|nr:hypothetical protein BT93_L4939 [Corymbia citriodora subsp. variegata]
MSRCCIRFFLVRLFMFIRTLLVPCMFMFTCSCCLPVAANSSPLLISPSCGYKFTLRSKMSGFSVKLAAFVVLLSMSGAVAKDPEIAPLSGMLTGSGFTLLVPCVVICCAVLLSLVHCAFQLT